MPSDAWPRPPRLSCLRLRHWCMIRINSSYRSYMQCQTKLRIQMSSNVPEVAEHLCSPCNVQRCDKIHILNILTRRIAGDIVSLLEKSPPIWDSWK
jgi:hypothetical protein